MAFPVRAWALNTVLYPYPTVGDIIAGFVILAAGIGLSVWAYLEAPRLRWSRRRWPVALATLAGLGFAFAVLVSLAAQILFFVAALLLYGLARQGRKESLN